MEEGWRRGDSTQLHWVGWRRGGGVEGVEEGGGDDAGGGGGGGGVEEGWRRGGGVVGYRLFKLGLPARSKPRRR